MAAKSPYRQEGKPRRFITLHRGGRAIIVPLRDVAQKLGRGASRVAGDIMAIPHKIGAQARLHRDAVIEAIARQDPGDLAGHAAAASAMLAENLMAWQLDYWTKEAERALVEVSRRHEVVMRQRLRGPIRAGQKAALVTLAQDRKVLDKLKAMQPLQEIIRPERNLQRGAMRELLKRRLLVFQDSLRRQGLPEAEVQKQTREFAGGLHALDQTHAENERLRAENERLKGGRTTYTS